ncbi:MAG TPA: hypothetical protein PKC43_11555 [Phycisphaerales bacterium]|nr:hypothetical protein [Phycisphaerales bacterium]HMP38068.1 hypothetical protein [Phycisphaerales bacterium]
MHSAPPATGCLSPIHQPRATASRLQQTSRPSGSRRWIGPLLGGGCAVVLALFAGCTQRQIRVEMTPGEEGVLRSVATNALDEEGRRALAEAYGESLRRDSATGGVQVASTFTGALPREPGSRSGLSRISSDLGTASFWYESISGDPADALGLERNDWRSLTLRMQAGELWVRLFGRWAGRQLPEGSQRDEFAAWVDRDLVPFCNNVVLRFAAAMTAATTNRIDASPRGRGDRGPRTEEEAFWGRIFMPLLLALAEEDADRQGRGAPGFFTMEELHLLLLAGIDGNAGGQTRDWVSKRIIIPAITRQVRRFRPDAPSVSRAGLVAMGFSFLLFVNGSSAADDLLLASPAIAEADKERLRRGERSISIPPPYGFGTVNGAKPIVAEVVLNLPDEPYLTNGIWNAKERRLAFRTEVAAATSRVELHAPIFFAAWAAPDEARQRALFGSVLLRGEDLAAYVAWHEMLDPRQRTAWAQALDALSPSPESGRGPDKARARAMLARTASMRQPPGPLVRFLEAP